jgi:hypothetical protein
MFHTGDYANEAVSLRPIRCPAVAWLAVAILAADREDAPPSRRPTQTLGVALPGFRKRNNVPSQGLTKGVVAGGSGPE